MSAVPGAWAVMRPVSSTETMPASSELQLTVLSVAVSGRMTHSSWAVLPIFSPISPGFRVTLSTGMVAEVTVTSQPAVCPPSTVVTVMVAVPSSTPVTVPVLSTVATVGLLLDHVTSGLVASSGATVAMSRRVSSAGREAEERLSTTRVTGTTSRVTVIRHRALWLPSRVVASTVVSPQQGRRPDRRRSRWLSGGHRSARAPFCRLQRRVRPWQRRPRNRLPP